MNDLKSQRAIKAIVDLARSTNRTLVQNKLKGFSDLSGMRMVRRAYMASARLIKYAI